MPIVRFNPFGQVHKGLRALLYDTALQIQQTNFTVEQEIHAVLERVCLVNSLFEHHAHIEDSRVFPMIRDVAPEVVADFESQHQTDHALSEDLERSIAFFNETNSPEQNRSAGVQLQNSFAAFLAFNVEHMRKEETIVNGVLWQHYSDEALLQKVQEISAAIPPQENRHFCYWMLKGMATHEIIDWYRAIKLSAPPPVLEFFYSLAEEALPAAVWNGVKEGLQEAPVNV
ncbi:MAG TPA: hemerythrin domain-containing protein [Flavisolibacter sp.]|nr:hemerythrin domain-containing protein [Flavisolibacter sp.]